MAISNARDDALILNVNDIDGTRYMITRMLDRAGFSVIEAATGEDALEKVRLAKPRLVVLDIKLPDASGMDVCRIIKSCPETQSIKVLHTSAVFVAAEYKVQSLDSGADGYLSHPFEQEELIATVRSLLRLTDTEQALRDRAEELKEANRRTTEFLAMLAHELRNPLAAIVTSLPLLERSPPTDSIDKMARELLKRQTTHLARLVDDLLDVARVTQGKIELEWEKVDLTELLRRVSGNIEQTKLTARKQLLNLRLPDAPVYVRGDATRLEQIFTNLLDNASKYTDPEGVIEVEIRGVSSDQDARNKVRIVVRDSGIGISADTLPTIFNLFSQADVPLARSRGGLGIGLTLVRTLVDLHGGIVTAQSAGPSKGSEFEVVLPVLAEVSQHAALPDSRLAVDGHTTPRRVLIIEDNVDAQQSLKALLEFHGHEVSVATDGNEGMRVALATQPDIALIDLGLPGLDGYEVARRIRQSAAGEDLLLIALTGYGAPEQRSRALESGFDVHLVKPVEPEQLVKIVSERARALDVKSNGMGAAARIRLA